MKKKNGVDETLEELEGLHKSEEEEAGEDAISTLEKALTEFDTFEGEEEQDGLEKSEEEEDGLEKSEEEEEQDGLEKSEDEGEEEEEVDPDLEKSEEEEEQDGLEKSEEEENFDLEDELVKASEAYADLEKSVATLGESTQAQLDDVVAAMADLTSLVKSIGSALVVTVKENRELRKALDNQFEAIGQLPGVSAAGLQLGLGNLKKSEDEETSQHSKSEVIAALTKSVRDEGKSHLAHYLSKVSCNGVGVVPENVMEEIGLAK